MKNLSLKRVLTLPWLVLYTLGNIVGAGIYILIAKIAQISGYYTPLAFLLASLVTLLSALSYAELVSRYPYSAAEALYLKKGFGLRLLPWLGGGLIILGGLFGAATLISGFYGYLASLIDIGQTTSDILLLIILFFIASWGSEFSVKVAGIFTLVELLGLLLIIFYGFGQIQVEDIQMQNIIPSFDFTDIQMTLLGTFLAFYAYTGFEDTTKLAEEAKNPKKDIPLAIIISLLIVTLLYVAVAFIAVMVMSPQELAKSDQALATLFTKLVSHKSYIINYIAIFAIVNGTLVQIIMVSRMLYGMARQGWLPSILAKIDPKSKTPIIAILLTTILLFLLTLCFDLLSLAQASNYGILALYLAIDISLIRIKIKKEAPQGSFTIPFWIPVAAVGINLVLFLFTLVY